MSENEVKHMDDETWKRNEEGIRKMMDQWADGTLTDAQATFNDVVGRKADTLVSDRKAEVAASIFNQPVEPEGDVVDASDIMPDQTGEVEEPVETQAEAEVETEEPETETEEENEDV